ncbi:hypothetical protein ACJIZ3_014253 [Penstemon smallii]|uniref:Uncharacterized protein n=1 Tax=Penstemon smallii TaxID=265156 RepID=A0ABD3RUF9_9LAMI
MAGKRKHTGKTMMDVVSEASSATGSLSRQSEARSSGSSDPSSQDKQMGRGRSKTTSLWESGAKHQLVLTDDGRIDGPHRVQFKTQLGVMARNANMFPLTKMSFKEIDPHVIDAFWKEIKQMGLDGRGRVRCGGQGIKPSQYRHALSVNDTSRELKEEMREEREQMRKEREQMREEREQMKVLMEQMTQRITHAQVVISQARNEMTQAMAEDMVSYFGLGNFPTAPFRAPIGQFSGAFRPFGVTSVRKSQN